MSHCSGWYAVKTVCSQAGVSLTATGNRHRISTLYAGMHMSSEDKECFFKHMGNAEAINRDNYQCPAGVQEIRVMGRMLAHLDSGNYETNFL